LTGESSAACIKAHAFLFLAIIESVRVSISAIWKQISETHAVRLAGVKVSSLRKKGTEYLEIEHVFDLLYTSPTES
jgi:hypothetical protein